MAFRIANAAGFLGDDLGAPCRLLDHAQVDVLTLEYLAELTMSILGRVRQRNPELGYARDFLTVLDSLLPLWKRQPGLRIVTNAGGVNPPGCARAAGEVLREAGLGGWSLAVLTGDDLLGEIPGLLASGCGMEHLETGQPLSDLKQPIVSANAYLGATGIREAMLGGAQAVITGRVADASLTVGPAQAEFGWRDDAWVELAGATVAGHLIECGAQVTGGYSERWEKLRLAEIGYPIAELEADGSCIITKPPGSGGVVDRRSVTEQLLYEIGDPSRYATPDVDVDFRTVELTEQAPDRVHVGGATGQAPSDMYKVSLSYQDGFQGTAQLLVYGRDCVKRAQHCVELVLDRLQQVDAEPRRYRAELLGSGVGVPLASDDHPTPNEVVLRITVQSGERDRVDRFQKTVTSLATSGPGGLAGYASGQIPVRPIHAYWPALIPKDRVTPALTIKRADEWATSDI